jgi:hypothetical protein
MKELGSTLRNRFDQFQGFIHDAHDTLQEKAELAGSYIQQSVGVLGQTLANDHTRDFLAQAAGGILAEYPTLSDIVITAHDELTHLPPHSSVITQFIRDTVPDTNEIWGIENNGRLIDAVTLQGISPISRALLGLSAFFDDQTHVFAQDFGTKTVQILQSA